jgi:hypothetical protein
MAGVLITDTEAVVADGFMLVIKTLQVNEMDFDKMDDDGIKQVIIPGDALKACDGELIKMQTIESMVKRELGVLPMGAELSQVNTKIVVRLDGADFSVEVDATDGNYPDYKHLFTPSALVGQFAVSTKVLKKLLRTLPDDSTLQFRISEPDKPLEFQCSDPDGDLPIRGLAMPMNMSWMQTKWLTPNVDKEALEK